MKVAEKTRQVLQESNIQLEALDTYKAVWNTVKVYSTGAFRLLLGYKGLLVKDGK